MTEESGGCNYFQDRGHIKIGQIYSMVIICL